MEEPANLLDDFIAPEADLEDYRKSYSSKRKITIALALFSFCIYTFYIDNKTGEEGGAAYRLGSALGVVLMIAIPSAFIGLLPGTFTDKKFPYKERYKKWFWVTAMLFAILMALCICLIGASENNIF